MPRASRYLREGYTYHLTHRCHDRRSLLRFKRERKAYREWLRVGAKRYGVPVYGYCITSSHTHVIAHVDDRESVARMMQLAAGSVGQTLNIRKGHEGSVWEHPYQCTMVEDGQHLLNCLRYVDMNMVRAGVVNHPQDWRWCGYDELTGQRKRYRIIDVDRLLQSLDLPDAASLERLHRRGVDTQVERGDLSRRPHWTEAVAIGGQEFVAQAEKVNTYRRRFTQYSVTEEGQPSTWVIKEAGSSYRADSEAESTL
jgi:putative transposase